jgi:hypothetical protein
LVLLITSALHFVPSVRAGTFSTNITALLGETLLIVLVVDTALHGPGLVPLSKCLGIVAVPELSVGQLDLYHGLAPGLRGFLPLPRGVAELLPPLFG